MSCKIVDYFGSLFVKKRQIYGEIRFSVNLSGPEEISFRVDAQEILIEWGDGETAQGSRIEPFQHHYMKAGSYNGCIRGKNITDIDIPYCYLRTLNVSACPTLEFLDCSDNELTELDLRNCTDLYEIYCAKNKIQELKLSKYKKLFYLSCSSNQLERLDLGGCTKLVTLRCQNNLLHKLDLKRCPKLMSVNIERNKFNTQELCEFLSALVRRPVYDKGFLVFRDEEEEEEYEWTECLNIMKKRGWCEI